MTEMSTNVEETTDPTTNSTEDAREATRSPSPPPPQPIAETPGVRATQFQALYTKTLAKTLSTLSYTNFATCFPTIASAAPESLKALHQTFISRLSSFATAEFAQICASRNVITSLNELEELLKEAKRRKAKAIDAEGPGIVGHEVEPQVLVDAHLAGLFGSAQGTLNAKLQNIQGENRRLAKEIEEQRREIEMLMGGLTDHVGDLRTAVEVLGEEDEEFRGLIRDSHRELTTSN